MELCSTPNKQRISTISLFVVAFLLSSFQHLKAAPILDQSFDATAGGASQAIYSGQSLAQTFTVGLSGRLDTIGLMLNRHSPTTSGDFTLSLMTTLGGTPDINGATLFEQTYSVFDVAYEGPFNYAFTDFDISTQNVHVTTGQELAIIVTHQGGNDNWMSWDVFSNGGTYAGGEGFFQNGFSNTWSTSPGFVTDRGFRTYVDQDIAQGPVEVSEPAPIALLSLSLLGLVIRKKGLLGFSRSAV